MALTASAIQVDDAGGRDRDRVRNTCSHRNANMTKSKTKKKILIVEDDSDFRAVLSRSLRQAGYEVSEAEHALGAICAMVRAGADLILTDIRMPIMDGLGLVRELKAHEDTCDVPVVAMTGFDTPENRKAMPDDLSLQVPALHDVLVRTWKKFLESRGEEPTPEEEGEGGEDEDEGEGEGETE